VPSCTDGALNGSETDVDCGGGTCPACVDGKKCSGGTDCTSGVCTAGFCTPASCGDGTVNGMEQCDDANMDNTDNCLSTCVFASCGDGFVHAGVETCDDGNTSNTDACLDTCLPATCGDGFVYAGMEACDDGNMDNTDACLDTCSLASCGDGFLYAGVEACDDGNMDNTDACPSTCAVATCGDGYVYAGMEACDDSNMVDGDCCSAGCGLEPGCEVEPNNTPAESLASAVFPPNGIIKARIIPAGDIDFLAITVSAVIDLQIETFAGFTPGACPAIDTLMELRAPDGMTVLASDDDDSPNLLCSLINPAVDPGARHLFPGTYYVRVNEYGDNATIDAYGVTLTATATCGNAVVEGFEECDGGPNCDANCDRIPVCGDGFIDTPENCDDGNLLNGDGCDSSCAVEAGYICGTIVGTCMPVCGDTTTISPETCDDGNQASGDGCDGACTTEIVLTEVEPNDTFADADARALDATPILISGSSTTLAGDISMIGNLDLFKMDLASDSVVRIETFNGTGADCTTGLTTTLRLFNASMTQVATDNVSGIGTCSALVLNVVAGTYYVQVEETGNNATIAAYKLQVKIQASKGIETEPNETQVAATAFTGSDVHLFGGHLLNADSDYYAIVVPAGRDVRAEIIEGGAKTCESNTMDTRLTLFNSLGVQLVDDDDSGRGYCSMIDGTGTVPQQGGAGNLPEGTYFLRVAASTYARGMDTDGQFDYRLAVTIR
jgi:cysteine-rich repeat protein